MPRPKIEDAQSRLLQVGLELFASRGTERVNSNLIARRAGLAIGTFYAHFSDKQALLREIELRTLSGLREARLKAIRQVPVNRREQALKTVEAAVHFAERHSEAYRVAFGRERAGAARHGAVVSESARPLAEGLRQLQIEGRISANLNLELAARAYLSMELGTLLWWLEDPSRATAAELIETLSALHPASITS
ncbi:MAG: TetR/AcrR family transcriptional regulator [Myxococcales bacterium]|nr:TetR/AcrR family transcriptional regulator [Myxococcales bacterium]HIK85087.1 TetR/AcrR family transcriptional regulator [Myxococcales bacterium]